jgi:hypothetical protein
MLSVLLATGDTVVNREQQMSSPVECTVRETIKGAIGNKYI